MNNNAQHIIRVSAIIIGCALAGTLYMLIVRTIYANTANKHWQSERYMARLGNPHNIKQVDSCTQMLQTGDLVVRRGDDMTSYMLSKLNLTDKSYSHCGLVVVEEGQPYVYHCIGGEDNPDQKMKRETAAQWFSPANNQGFAVYRYTFHDSTIDLITKQVYKYYNQQVMFDMDFDMDTDERMYCSEMIYKAISTAVSNPDYFKTEKNYGKRFIGVDNLYLHACARQVCQIKFK